MKKSILLFGVLILMVFLSQQLLANYSDNTEKYRSKTGSDDYAFLSPLSLLDYNVTFHVTSNGNDLEGAWVTVGPVTLQTNVIGIAVFSLQDGNYNYTVTKEGYADQEGSFTVSGAPIEIEVEMEVCYYVGFHVISNGITLTGCIITIGDYVYNNDTTSSICLPEGTYFFTVSKPGYNTVSGYITVPPGPATINIILTPILFNVTFFVNCCGEPLANIPITYGTVTVTTDAAGIAVLQFNAGNYTINIGGYIFTFTVPETIYLDADICSEITFHVTNEQGYPLENVLIEVDDSNLFTDFNGEAVICLQVGSYTYVASKPGYVWQSGTIEVDTLPQIIEVVMPVTSYGVTFHIVGIQCNNEFDGIIIIINGDTLLAGESIDLSDGSYNWTVVLLGCGMLTSGMVTINGAPVTFELMVTDIPKVTFHVTSTQIGNIQGAEVVVEEDTLYTNSSGEATFCMTGGDHYYAVAKENFDTINDIFNFPCENITIEVLMDPVAINNLNSSEFRLYPNPSTGKFYLETKNLCSDPIELQVMDLTGRIVFERQSFISEKFEIDLSGQQNGMYFLRIKTEEENYILKSAIKI
jgi:uncharacterized membrane protein